MKTRELRAEARIVVSQRGQLSSGNTWFPCMVLDMSDNGFLIMSSKELVVGQVLEFRCELFPGKTLECKIETRHVSDAGVGTKIVEIDKKGISLCQLFLQEQYSDKLNRSG
ncbi:MAG: PilZ domain-containing protein [Betaproteobacteria bacterium]|nr:PilZ domain-containing protein [Betaproteobacteria bacterium]